MAKVPGHHLQAIRRQIVVVVDQCVMRAPGSSLDTLRRRNVPIAERFGRNVRVHAGSGGHVLRLSNAIFLVRGEEACVVHFVDHNHRQAGVVSVVLAQLREGGLDGGHFVFGDFLEFALGPAIAVDDNLFRLLLRAAVEGLEPFDHEILQIGDNTET